MRFLFITCLLFACFLLSDCSTDKRMPNNSSVLHPLSNTGISFENKLTETSGNNVLEYDYFYNGGGVGIGDLNNDGLQDLVLTGNQVSNKIYLNTGQLKFEEKTLNSNKWSTGVAIVDLNKDGLKDIYICNSGPDFSSGKRANELWLNQGNGKFTESAEKYGIDDDSGSTQAAFFDFDKDGDLDLFVLNHSQYLKLTLNDFYKMTEALKSKKYPHLPSYHSQSCHLYKNQNNQYFEDITEQAGVLDISFGLGVLTLDFNGDGWTDIYVANDYQLPDKLYINNQNGTFTDQIKFRTRHTPYYSMGCDAGDINNDGFIDLMTLDMAPIGHYRSKTLMPSMNPQLFNFLTGEKEYHSQYMFNSLQLNNGNYTFRDVGQFGQVAGSDWSWAALVHDFDLDGQSDILVTNGFRRDTKNNDWRASYKKMQDDYPDDKAKHFAHLQQCPSEKISNLLYQNKGNYQFEDVAKAWNFDMPTFSNGAAYADLDNDGDSEIIINNIDDKALIFNNNAIESGQNYLKIQFRKVPNPVFSYNTKATLYAGDEVFYNEYHPIRGFQGCLSDELVFGLGDRTAIDSLEITWPNNATETFYEVKINTSISAVPPTTLRAKLAKSVTPLFRNSRQKQSALAFLHRENPYDDFKTEILLPHKMSQQGPHISTGDIDKNGETDFYIGGAKGQSGALYKQVNGKFQLAQSFEEDAGYEDIGSVFFDADGDGDEDLYVISGGSDSDGNPAFFQDRLYDNKDGKFANVTKQKLPVINSSGSVVRVADWDKDGDLDLLVCSRHQPGAYPSSGNTMLLINNGGKFENKTVEIGGEALQKAGLITAAEWLDMNDDNYDDLLLTGEWMSPKIFKNEAGKSLSLIEKSEWASLNGLWQGMQKGDLDGDGDEDIVLGNIGQNSKFHPTEAHPLNLYYNDFDENGSFDIVLAKDENNKEVPVRGRQCSSEQMPFIAEKFQTYDAFAKADLSGILGKEKIDKSLTLYANTFKSILLENKGNFNFGIHELPVEMQLSTINSICLQDFNKDGKNDIFLAGNLYETEVETPRYDAGKGDVLINLGHFKFDVLDISESGLYLPMNVKSAQLIKVGKTDNYHLIIGNNDNVLQCYTTN